MIILTSSFGKPCANFLQKKITNIRTFHINIFDPLFKLKHNQIILKDFKTISKVYRLKLNNMKNIKLSLEVLNQVLKLNKKTDFFIFYGGNTKYILSKIKEYKIDQILSRIQNSNCNYLGISAGCDIAVKYKLVPKNNHFFVHWNVYKNNKDWYNKNIHIQEDVTDTISKLSGNIFLVEDNGYVIFKNNKLVFYNKKYVELLVN